jgi:hypothetical protein
MAYRPQTRNEIVKYITDHALGKVVSETIDQWGNIRIKDNYGAEYIVFSKEFLAIKERYQLKQRNEYQAEIRNNNIKTALLVGGGIALLFFLGYRIEKNIK